MLSTLAFDPSQPRDEQGQWTGDGGNAYVKLDKARLVFHSISVGDRGLESVELALHPDVKTDTWRSIDGMISVDWNSMPTGVTKENIVGSVKIYRHGDALTGSSLQVEEAYRRQGIATLLYDKIESEKGRLTPEFKQTSVGAAFWKSRSALSFPLAPAHGARLLLLASMRVNGGVGSGNFGHAGRPGEVGGSSDVGGGKETFFHGTKGTLVKKILKEGLLSSKSHSYKNRGFLQDQGGFIYLAESLDTASAGSQNAVVFHVRISQDKLDKDPIDTKSFRVAGRIAPEHIEAVSVVVGKEAVRFVIDKGQTRRWKSGDSQRDSWLSEQPKFKTYPIEAYRKRFLTAGHKSMIYYVGVDVLDDSNYVILNPQTEELKIRGAAVRAANPLHAAADAHVAKLSVAIRYAFAMGRKALKPMLRSLEFDPNQPRDEQGQWTSGGLWTSKELQDGGFSLLTAKTTLAGVTYEIYGGNRGSRGQYLVVSDGKEIGRAQVSRLGRGKYLDAIDVEISVRRQGIGSALYDAIEDHLGRKLEPSAVLSKDAQEVWRQRSASSASDSAGRAASAIRAALQSVLPATLTRVVAAGGEVGVEGLREIRVAGGPGSGNFGHAGRPGEVGGSGDGAGASFRVPEDFKLEDAEYDVNTRFPLDKMVVASVDLDLLSIPYPTDWRVREMVDVIEQGTKFPPITVEQYPDKLVIVDGNTRVAALKEMGIRGSVPAVIRLYGDGSPLPKGVIIDEKRTSSLRAPVKALGLRTAKPRDKTLRMRFDVTNPAVVAWVKQHSAELVTQITDTSRERIRLAIEDLAEEGDFDLATDRIMAAVGDADRANLIARHEMMLAANEGQRQAWDQAVEKGLLPEDAQRTWIITPDEKVCPICEPLDGTTADLRGEYADGISGPPAHVQCRCTEGITELRAAEFNPDQPRDESGKWTSSGGGIILHGTAEELVSSILKDGLLASKAGTIFPDSKPGHVFLTTNEQLARVAAETAAERISGYSPSHPQFGQSGQLPAVLEVHVPANVLGKDKLLVDSYSHRGDIPGEWIKGVSIRTSAGWEKKDPSDYRGLEESRIFFVPWVFVTEAERI